MSASQQEIVGGERRTGRARSQLSAEELQQVRWLLGGALILLSVATVFYLDLPAWTLMALTVGAVGAALVRPDWPARVPRWAHRLAFPAIVAVFAGDLWLTGELLPAMVRLDLLLLLYRGVTYRKKRDDLQVIVLGLFLVVVAGVLTVSLTFALQLLAFTAGALVFLLVITLSETGEGRSAAGEATDSGAPAWAREVRWRRLWTRVRAATDWRVVALASGLFAGLVAVTALLFLAIPRFQLENSLFLERFVSKKAKTGFSDTIRFGEVTEIQQDNGVALSVDVTDRSRVPAAPYWRMLVLDEYRDGTFRMSPALRRDAMGRELGGMNVRGTRRRSAEEPATWTFYLEAGVSRFLPLLGEFEALRFSEPRNFRFGGRLGIVALRDEPVSMMAYRVEGMATGARLPDREFGERWGRGQAVERRAAALMLRLGVAEPDAAELRRVVAEIRGSGGAEDAGAFATRASAWLDARHAYSLQPRIPAGPGDPLVRWLVSREGGHCELFAGSLVLLARAAGIPARVVTGFRGGSWNGYSNNFTLRNADAHAWVEVFDATGGAWVRADPTPGGNVSAAEQAAGEAGLARRADRSWTARFDSLRVFWYRRVVNFDQQTQLETMKAVKETAENSGKRLRAALARWGARAKAWAAAPWTGGRAMVVAAWLVLAVGGGWAVWNLRSWLLDLRFGRRGARMDVVRAEAGRWLGRLRRARGDGGNDARAGAAMEELAAVEAALLRLRFGARETWGDAGEIFRRARTAVRAARRRAVAER